MRSAMVVLACVAAVSCKPRSYNAANDGSQPLAWDVKSSGGVPPTKKDFRSTLKKLVRRVWMESVTAPRS